MKEIPKLQGVKVNKENFEKIDFTFACAGRSFVITLKEKFDWPLVLNQPLNLVEKWFLANYGDVLTLMGLTK